MTGRTDRLCRGGGCGAEERKGSRDISDTRTPLRLCRSAHAAETFSSRRNDTYFPHAHTHTYTHARSTLYTSTRLWTSLSRAFSSFFFSPSSLCSRVIRSGWMRDAKFGTSGALDERNRKEEGQEKRSRLKEHSRADRAGDGEFPLTIFRGKMHCKESACS